MNEKKQETEKHWEMTQKHSQALGAANASRMRHGTHYPLSDPYLTPADRKDSMSDPTKENINRQVSARDRGERETGQRGRLCEQPITQKRTRAGQLMPYPAELPRDG